jgi:hypothetical protein
MKRRRGKCKECGEDRELYALGLCPICYTKVKRREAHTRTISSRTTSTPTRKRKPLNARSLKRQEQEKEYAKVRDEVKRAQKVCFFCDKEVKDEDCHHLKGRDGELISDKEWLVHVHRKCHDMYHGVSIHKWPWLTGFLSRLKQKSNALYQKELNKLDK